MRTTSENYIESLQRTTENRYIGDIIDSCYVYLESHGEHADNAIETNMDIYFVLTRKYEHIQEYVDALSINNRNLSQVTATRLNELLLEIHSNYYSLKVQHESLMASNRRLLVPPLPAPIELVEPPSVVPANLTEDEIIQRYLAKYSSPEFLASPKGPNNITFPKLSDNGLISLFKKIKTAVVQCISTVSTKLCFWNPEPIKEDKEDK